MANNETGHAINVANLKVLADYCTELGEAYKPANDEITMDKLNALYLTAKTAHEQVNAAAMSAKQPLNERETLFQPLDKLVTRVLNSYASSKATKNAVADAKGLADKIRGFGLNPRKDKDKNVIPDHVSNAQLSYVQRVDAFKKLTELLGTDGNYAPTEPELKLDELQSRATAMTTINETVGGILAPLATARSNRYNILYAPETGALDLVQKVKKYCKSIAATNPEVVKKIQAIKLKRIPA